MGRFVWFHSLLITDRFDCYGLLVGLHFLGNIIKYFRRIGYWSS